MDSQRESMGSGWGVLEVLVRNRRQIIWYPVIVAVVVGVFALVVPSSYLGETTILPPDRDFQSLTLSNLPLAEMGLSSGMALPFMATPSDILAHVLQSRRVLRAVVDSLRLDAVWQLPSASSAVESLRRSLTVKVELTALVRVQVVDRDPRRAAQLANTVVFCADRLNRSIANSKARYTREFIESRLVETRQALAAAGNDLEAFQRAHKTISLDDELRALIQNAAALNAALMADDIELSVLKKNMSAQNPRVAVLQDRISETRRRLAAMETGQDSTMFPSTGLQEAPQLVLELADKTRRMKIEVTLLELLTSQYESAKIQEAKDTPTISVLDYAEPEAGRHSPRRMKLVLASWGASLAVVVGLAFVGEYLAVLRRRKPAQYERLRELGRILRRDGLGLRRQRTDQTGS